MPNLSNLALVMIGGAFGTAARYLQSAAMLRWLGPGFPWATLTINITGSLLMGVLAGVLLRLSLGDAWRLFLGVGMLGGYTTFSAFSLDAVMLAQRGQTAAAIGYVAGSVLVALPALLVGLALTRAAA